MSVTLGKKYRDKISGFEGTATARTEYLYGCVRVVLEMGKEGELKTDWFDEQRLVDAGTGEPVISDATTGGPMPTPPSCDPRR